jgi:hypothetical protein
VQPTPGFIQALILKAVRQHAAAAIQSRSMISAAGCAAQTGRTYPGCQLDQAELIDEIAFAAARAGVAVQVGPPKEAGCPA